MLIYQSIQLSKPATATANSNSQPVLFWISQVSSTSRSKTIDWVFVCQIVWVHDHPFYFGRLRAYHTFTTKTELCRLCLFGKPQILAANGATDEWLALITNTLEPSVINYVHFVQQDSKIWLLAPELRHCRCGGADQEGHQQKKNQSWHSKWFLIKKSLMCEYVWQRAIKHSTWHIYCGSKTCL